MAYTFDKNKELASYAGKKGGAAKTDWKKVSKRKYCSMNCPFFDRCPLAPLAMQEVVIKADGRKAHPCLLNQASLPVRRAIKRLFLEDEEGFLDELREAIFTLKTKAAAEGDMRSLNKYIDTLLKAHNILYGQRIRQEGNIDINIRLEVIGEDLNE